MAAPIVIEITPQARAVIAKLQRFPQDIGAAIKRGMDDAGNQSWREIERQRFMGLSAKPFPVSEHRLRNISDRLHTSLFYRAATVTQVGNQVSVTGRMGSEGVVYFPIHEYGFSGSASVKPFFRKNRGGKGGHDVKGHTRRMNIPARAPLHTGLEDHKILFQTKIQEQLVATLNAKP